MTTQTTDTAMSTTEERSVLQAKFDLLNQELQSLFDDHFPWNYWRLRHARNETENTQLLRIKELDSKTSTLKTLLELPGMIEGEEEIKKAEKEIKQLKEKMRQSKRWIRKLKTIKEKYMGEVKSWEEK